MFAWGGLSVHWFWIQAAFPRSRQCLCWGGLYVYCWWIWTVSNTQHKIEPSRRKGDLCVYATTPQVFIPSKDWAISSGRCSLRHSRFPQLFIPLKIGVLFEPFRHKGGLCVYTLYLSSNHPIQIFTLFNVKVSALHCLFIQVFTPSHDWASLT